MEKENPTIVIIPSYEPSHNFIAYIQRLVLTSIQQVIVVNDGSGKEFDEIFEEISKVNKVKVISYTQNKGKGYALKQAFVYCKENNDENSIYVTADCDGQHRIEDILNVARMAGDRKDSLTLGSRNFDKKNVPSRSRFGNKNTCRIFRFFYGVNINDTQTGLRAFSYSLLDELLSVKGNRFEYEMNVLIHFHKKDIEFSEVPIETVYEEKPKDVKTISHYNTFKDSFLILGVLFSNMNWYVLSSCLSALIDVFCFYLLMSFAFGGITIALQTLLATVFARVLSSIVNFVFNFKLVFHGKSNRAILRYYILWTFQLFVSYGFAYLWEKTFNVVWITTVLKGATDLILAVFSYQIQKKWVFANQEKDRLHFYGLYFKIVRFFGRIFYKKYKNYVQPRKEGVVYVCRHLNLHGPLVLMKCLNFDVHLYILNVFFSYKKCYHQFKDYTFSVREGMGKFKSTIFAFFAALAVAPLFHSSKSIPVYRNSGSAVITLRESLKCLKKGQNIVVFPDIDYTAKATKQSDIYDGFLWLEKIYYRETKKHLKFVPLIIDEENGLVREDEAISFKDEGEFKEQKEVVKEALLKSFTAYNSFCNQEKENIINS